MACTPTPALVHTILVTGSFIHCHTLALAVPSVWNAVPVVRDYQQAKRWRHGWEQKSESCSVVSDSLQAHGLYSPWNSPGQNTGVGSLSLLQGIFPAEGLNPGLLHCKWFFLPFEPPGEPKNTIPSPVDLPDPGIELGSPALPADSLPTELSGTLVGPRTALNF